jgi:hypothetical protein
LGYNVRLTGNAEGFRPLPANGMLLFGANSSTIRSLCLQLALIRIRLLLDYYLSILKESVAIAFSST